MTRVDFYKKLSDIIEHFTCGVYTYAKATEHIDVLNAEAKAVDLKLVADSTLLNSVIQDDLDEAYEDDYDDDDDWFDNDYPD